MPGNITVKGRLVGPRQVELDRPVHDVASGVEVTLHPAAAGAGGDESVFEFLKRMPAGRRTRAEIDRQIQTERDAWGGR